MRKFKTIKTAENDVLDQLKSLHGKITISKALLTHYEMQKKREQKEAMDKLKTSLRFTDYSYYYERVNTIHRNIDNVYNLFLKISGEEKEFIAVYRYLATAIRTEQYYREKINETNELIETYETRLEKLLKKAEECRNGRILIKYKNWLYSIDE